MDDVRNHSSPNHEKTVFEKAVEKESFKNLMRTKRKFIVPFTIFFLIVYFTLPILTSYSTILNKPAIGDISWVWVFAIFQFIMTWTLVTIYMKKSQSFDRQAGEIVQEEFPEGGRGA